MADLKNKEGLLRKAKEDVDAADLADDRKIADFQHKNMKGKGGLENGKRGKKRRKKEWLRFEKSNSSNSSNGRSVREKQQKPGKKWEEEEKIRQKQMYEEAKRSQERYSIPDHFFKSEERTHQTCNLTCYHDCWWSKVQGRTACPECHEVWTYLLKCPGCDMKACPRYLLQGQELLARTAGTATTTTEEHLYSSRIMFTFSCY
ncbi:hypothetical protein DID88_008791 [Monilinia fructigena]|uniref:Uncharacterized protein n=1 Tax=Monilinia fructigena TaxID=38457 RepID=A0A395J6W1_9HELO|nr:hypothetical protein DID88_008791 [Monilinia fructigena]